MACNSPRFPTIALTITITIQELPGKVKTIMGVQRASTPFFNLILICKNPHFVSLVQGGRFLQDFYSPAPLEYRPNFLFLGISVLAAFMDTNYTNIRKHITHREISNGILGQIRLFSGFYD
jgi:hypothetical protein